MRKVKIALGAVIGFALLIMIVIGINRPITGSVVSAEDKHNHARINELTEQSFVRNKAYRKSRRADPLVTDNIAFGIALKMVGANKDAGERAIMLSYAKKNLGLRNEADRTILFSVAETYRLESNRLQMASEAVIAKYHPTHSTISQVDQRSLDELEKDKGKLISDAVKDLKKDLTTEGYSSLETYVLQVIKPGIVEHKAL